MYFGWKPFHLVNRYVRYIQSQDRSFLCHRHLCTLTCSSSFGQASYCGCNATTSMVILSMRAQRAWLETGPQKLKWVSVAPTAAGWLAGTWFVLLKCIKNLTIACFRQLNASISNTVHWAEAIFKEREFPVMWSCDHPMGEGCRLKLAK